MIRKYLTIAIGLLFLTLNAQNEFYINGDNNISTHEVYVNDKDGTNPTLFVAGEIVNNQGLFTNNNGEIELTGNFTNNANDTNAAYVSTGIERFSGNSTSRVSGNLNGNTGNTNQFYDLKVNKDDVADLLELNTNVHVNSGGTVEFEADNIIRTDISSHGKDGASYANYLLVRNTSNAAIIGESLTPGTTNRYVEGKLRWFLANGANSYGFPIGGSTNGVEPFGIATTGAVALILEGHITPQSEITSLSSSGVVYHDVGTPTAPPPTTVASDGCSGGADGVRDKIELNAHTGIGWQVSNISGGGATYNINFAPASANNITPYNPYNTDNDCGNINLLYISKDLVPGGSASNLISGTQDWPTTPGYEVAPNTSTTIAGVTGYTLTGMTTFSTFGMHTTQANNVALPVELVSLVAYGVENKHINVDWVTATEINNEGFDVERSINGIDFSKVGYVQGNGNTTENITYRFEDFEVQKDIVYYYRLKQIDYDGEFEYTNVVSASLKGEDNGVYVSIYPNPSNVREEVVVEITSNIETDAQIVVNDIIGKLILNDNVYLTEGKNKYIINNGFLAVGQYFVTVKMPQQQLTKNIIVTE